MKEPVYNLKKHVDKKVSVLKPMKNPLPREPEGNLKSGSGSSSKVLKKILG